MRIQPTTSSYFYTNNKEQKSYKNYYHQNNICFQRNMLVDKFVNLSKLTIKNSKLLLFIAGLSAFTSCSYLYRQEDKERYVKPSVENFENKEDAIQYGIDVTKSYLNIDSPREYGVMLDYNDYSVVSEKLGKEHSVRNYPLKLIIKDLRDIEHPYIHIHGHPESKFPHNNVLYTQSFSFQDFIAFNSNENYKESYVVNRYGQHCVFKKTEDYQKIPKEELDSLEKIFDEEFYYSWPNAVNVYRNDSVIHTFHDQQGVHRFWKDLSKKYNFEYYTTYGVFDGIDAYENSFYPEEEMQTLNLEN